MRSRNVNIPNANFKAALVGNPAINTNGDGEIQVSEATAFSGTINVSSLSIADLTGIEAFTALTQLWCKGNDLTSLDVSANTALTLLYCSENQLTSLNVSANTALTYLNCSSNQLTSLNVSTNTALTELDCYENQLTSLNVSANKALTGLFCDSNQLTSLNVQNGNNINFWGFDAADNRNLRCIQVDKVSFMETNWGEAKDAKASYNVDCP